MENEFKKLLDELPSLQQVESGLEEVGSVLGSALKSAGEITTILTPLDPAPLKMASEILSVSGEVASVVAGEKNNAGK